jgi:site-specific recombinase XerD
VPIAEGLQQYLRLWLEHDFRDACAYAEKTDYLIPGENTEQLGERTVQEVVHQAAKAAGIQEVIFPGR